MNILTLFKSIPFLRFSFALGTGIFISEYIDEHYFAFCLIGFAIVAFLLLCVLLWPLVYQNYRNRWLMGLLFFVFLVNLGVVLNLSSRPTKLKTHYSLEAKARIIESDVTSSGYYCFTVVPLEVISEKQVPVALRDRWLIYVEPKDSLFVMPARAGNTVAFKTDLCSHSKPSNPGSFDFDRYLFRQGISGTGFVKQENFKVLSNSGFRGLSGHIKNMRTRAFRIYKDYGISGDELQILAALTLGIRQGIDDEVKSWFVHTGAIHVLAVSGLHVGIIFVLLNWALNALFLPKRSFLRVTIVISALIFYTFFTGGSPSIIRAVIMLSVIQIGNFINKNGNIYNLLGVSAFIIFLIQPMSLFHVGFWLSHLAVAGIVSFYPEFHKLYAGGNLFVRYIGDLLSVSLSAQIGTFPLSLFVFRAFPLWFFLSNFFILPLVAPILVLGNFLVIFAKCPWLATVFAGGLDDLLELMIQFARWLNSFPASYVQGLWMGGATMLFLYVLITFASLWYHFKITSFFRIFLLACVLILGVLNWEYLRKRGTDAFIVFDSGREPLVGEVKGGRGYLYTEKKITTRQINFDCSGFFSKYAFDEQRYDLFEDLNIRVFSLDDGYYLVIGDINLDGLNMNAKICNNTRGVVFMGDVKGDVAGFLKQIGCSRIILSGACPHWCVERWLGTVKKEGCMVYNVPQAGAYLTFKD